MLKKIVKNLWRQDSYLNSNLQHVDAVFNVDFRDIDFKNEIEQ